MDIFPDDNGVEEAAHDLQTICDLDKGRAAMAGAVAPAVLALGYGAYQAVTGQYGWLPIQLPF